MTDKKDKEDKKEEFVLTDNVSLKWFYFLSDDKKECEGMPEWEDLGGAYDVPKTKKQWESARLFEWDGGEIGDELDDIILRENISTELLDFLEDNGYEVNISVEYVDDIKPLKISKMGRKKIINISPTDELKLGDNVKSIKDKYSEGLKTF